MGLEWNRPHIYHRDRLYGSYTYLRLQWDLHKCFTLLLNLFILEYDLRLVYYWFSQCLINLPLVHWHIPVAFQWQLKPTWVFAVLVWLWLCPTDIWSYRSLGQLHSSAAKLVFKMAIQYAFYSHIRSIWYFYSTKSLDEISYLFILILKFKLLYLL